MTGTARRPGFRALRAAFAAGLVLALAACLWGAHRCGDMADEDRRDDLLAQIQAVALTLGIQDAKGLAFSKEDRSRPAFQRLRTQMKSCARALNLRSLYSVAQQGTNYVFGPESLAENDPQSSSPGTVYRRPPLALAEAFRDGHARACGPYTDEYGEFVSAFAPVLDPVSGRAQLVVGADIEVGTWRTFVKHARQIPLAFTFLVLGLVTAGLYLRARHPAARGSWLHRHIEPILGTATGVAASLYAGWLVHTTETRSRAKDFTNMARAQSANVMAEIARSAAMLDHLACFFEAETDVDRREFGAYARGVVPEVALQNCAWIPLVRPGDGPAFEARVRAGDAGAFEIWREGAGGAHIPPDPSATLFPVLYIEPEESLEFVPGFDLGSDPVQRETLIASSRSGRATALPVSPPGPAGTPPTVTVFQPIGGHAGPGFVAVVLRLDRMLARSMHHAGARESDVEAVLYEFADDGPPRFVACTESNSCAQTAPAPEPGQLRIMTPVFAFGRTYGICICSRPSYLAARPMWEGTITGLTGLLLTAMLAGIIGFLSEHRIRLAREVDARTADLQREHDNLLALMSAAPVGVMVFDNRARLVEANPAARRMFRMPASGTLPTACGDFLCCAHRHDDAGGCGHTATCPACPLHAGLAGVLAGGAGVHDREMEAELEQDGAKRLLYLRFSIEPVSLAGRTHAVVAVTDETERRRSKQQYDMLFREMLDGFVLHEVISDRDGRPIDYRFVSVNPAFERMTGMSAEVAIGRTVRELVPASEASWIGAYDRVALTGLPTRFEHRSADLARNFEVAVFRPSPAEIACVFADITARKAAEEGRQAAQNETARLLAVAEQSRLALLSILEDQKLAEEERMRMHTQLMQAQKMESIGTLAGGVAHDFNNKLHIIQGYVEWAIEATDPDSDVRTALLEIQTAASHSADIARQLLAFARKQTVHPKRLDLNDTISGTIKMLRRLIGEDIELVWKPGAALWPVFIDPSQLDQVIANLAVNARDAIRGVGTLTVATANVPAQTGDGEATQEPDRADCVMLSVTDTGVGMDEATMAHIFEPFFTTKDVGKGTGLGLATVDGIVRQNGGLIRVRSRPGAGTTFEILLPRHREEAPLEETTVVERPASGTETLLVVEDEAPILALCSNILENYGYTVLTASSPTEALAVVEEHGGTIDLLITDVVMPEMNGRELKERLVAGHPGIRVLYISGFPADALGEHGFVADGTPLLPKPFAGDDLAAMVRRILDH